MNTQPTYFWPKISTRTALILIVSVGFLVRLPDLDRDLWFDEASSLFNARGADVLTTKIIPNGPEFTCDMFLRDGGWRESLRAISHAEYMPPLYFLLLRLWIKFVGESNVALRLLSVIFGLATLLAMFLLGRTVFDEKIGFAAAGVLAILPLHIQYSQEIRPYALSLFFVTLASWAFWRACQAIGQPEESRRWLLYCGLAAASLYTIYLTAGILIAHGLFSLMRPPSARVALVKRLLLVALVLVLLMLPWLLSPYFDNQIELLESRSASPPFWAPDLLRRFVFLGYFLSVGNLPGANLKSLSGLFFFVLCLLCAVVLIRAAWQHEDRRTLLFALLLLFMPILLAAGLAATFNQVVLIALPRYILSSLAGLSLLLAVAMISSRWRAVSLVISGLLLVISFQFQVRSYRLSGDPTPFPFVEWAYGNLSSAVAEVSKQAGPEDLILFDDPLLVSTWNVYQRTPVAQLLMSEKNFYSNSPLDFESRWQEVERKYQCIYLVRRAGGPPSEIMERLNSHHHLTGSERVGRLELYHYIRPPTAVLLNGERK
ncbi:MAG: glycosyltransferase family 39 protein [candidate division WOR-3 bacterium]